MYKIKTIFIYIFVKHKTFHNRFLMVAQYLILITLNNNFLKTFPRDINKSQIYIMIVDGTNFDVKKVR